MRKKSKIPTILVIVILLVGIFAGVFFLNTKQIFRIGASATTQPKDIKISNISDNSATVSWITDSQTSDFLAWGEREETISKVAEEETNSKKSFTHNVFLSGLKPNTNYFFKINSGGTNYSNNEIPWKFTTGATLGINTASLFVSGSVIDISGQPVNRALIYITVNNYVASTTTSDKGNFVYQLGNIRTPDLQNYAQIDPKTTLLQISVSAGIGGPASVQIFPQSANPIPPIILGQTYDFRNSQPGSDNQIPNVNLSLPSTASRESKINVGSPAPLPAQKSVILESLKEGETVTSTRPEFFGKGPPGETVTIEVNSDDPITGKVTIPKDGSWSFAVPTGLAPGAHSVTITWKDTTGITRSLTRNFVVQASDVPAFEATPSETLAPNATPTAIPEATSEATLTPEPVTTPSEASVPATGNLTPTLLFSMLGVLIMVFGVFVWKTAEA